METTDKKVLVLAKMTLYFRHCNRAATHMERNMFKFERTLNTNGGGYWSNEARAVKTLRLEVPWIDEEDGYGELRIYFDKKTWKVKKHGLIYTDRQFEKELREQLDLVGLPGKDVDYSEQGMQGEDYVSCDIGKKFVKAWLKKVEELTPSL